MSLPIQPTTPVTGKQAEKILRSMENKEGYGKDELKFTINMKEFKKRIYAENHKTHQ